MRWSSFLHSGQTYDLAHLHPCTMLFEKPAADRSPVFIYTVEVSYSLHCFSRRRPDAGPYDRSLHYSDAFETRLFDFYRYELSKRLPEIVATLPQRQCRHTGHGNYFSVDFINDAGARVEYDVFFKVTKPGKGRLALFLQSAYVRDQEYGTNRPTGKPIRFLVILHNTLNQRIIRN